MDKIDQQYLNEIVGGTESGEPDTQHDLKVHEENTTIEELEVHCIVNRFHLDQVMGTLLSQIATFYHFYKVYLMSLSASVSNVYDSVCF